MGVSSTQSQTSQTHTSKAVVQRKYTKFQRNKTKRTKIVTQSLKQRLQPPLKAIILAAGYGKRLKHISKKYPKPLVTINGKTLLDHALEKLDSVPCSQIVINVHYMAEKIETHVKLNKKIKANIILSDERDKILDTGGGVFKALPHLKNKNKPFIILNSDCLWMEKKNTIQKLILKWDTDNMDCLMLLAKKEKACGYDGNGNFNANKNGMITIPKNKQYANYIYTGLCLVSPKLFYPDIIAKNPNKPFSMRLLWESAIEKKRLFGIIHDNLWIHVGTPEAIIRAEEEFKRQKIHINQTKIK